MTRTAALGVPGAAVFGCNLAIFACYMQSWHDTIVALATPPGVGALGIIRLSGPQAIMIAQQLMPAAGLPKRPSHTVKVGWIEWATERIDEAVATIFRAPRSFTGEDVVEFSCHGSPYILQQVISAAVAAGARLAKPGEFTQRAFLNGKMDLAQAEAVADVIASHSAAAHHAAIHQMRGGFSHVLAALREQLIKFSALIELELDFATEDVEFADRTALLTLIGSMDQTVRALLQSFQLGNVIKQGVAVAIVGKPNAGKSTLLNALLNENRAIVSDIAGTTRDTIEEVLNIDGILFRLIDTAGIRHSKGDVIEDIGMTRAKQNAEKADIIIHLIDMIADEEQTIDWLGQHKDKVIEVSNKYDHAWNDYLNKTGILVDLAAGIYISAKDNKGIDELKRILYEKAVDGSVNAENTVVTNARHYAALQQVASSLTDIDTGLRQGTPADLIALDIRRCLHFLGEITGAITNEDQLDYIFSKFCIGK